MVFLFWDYAALLIRCCYHEFFGDRNFTFLKGLQYNSILIMVKTIKYFILITVIISISSLGFPLDFFSQKAKCSCCSSMKSACITKKVKNSKHKLNKQKTQRLRKCRCQQKTNRHNKSIPQTTHETKEQTISFNDVKIIFAASLTEKDHKINIDIKSIIQTSSYKTNCTFLC